MLFRSTKTLFLKLQPDQEESIEEEKFSFDYQVEFPDSIKNKFIVVIKSLIEHKSGYHLDTIFLAEFQTDIEIDENFNLLETFEFANTKIFNLPYFTNSKHIICSSASGEMILSEKYSIKNQGYYHNYFIGIIMIILLKYDK